MEALLRKIREYLRKHHNARQLRRTIMPLAMVVVFVTTYVLILPAITIDKDTAATDPAIVMDASAEEDIQTATEKAEETPAPETEAPETEAPEEVTQPETVELEPETNAPQAAPKEDEPKGDEKQKDSETQKDETTQADTTAAGKTENQKDEPRDTEAASDAKDEKKNIPAAGKATYKTKDFTITVTWDKDAGLMADTALNLQELIREERKEPTPYDYVNEEYYDGYVNGTRYALQKSIDKTVEIADVRFLQLYLTYEGQIVTPKNKVKVDIEYKKPVEKVEKTTIKAVHFDAEKEEPVVLPVKVKVKPGEDGAPDTIEKLRFETSRISFYGITYVQLNSEEAAEEQNETLAEDEAPTEESSAVDETQDTDEKTVFYTEDEDQESGEAEGEESKSAEETADTEDTADVEETTGTEETEDGEETTAAEEAAETAETAETEDAESQPITFTDLSTNVIVNVTAPADAFPEGTTMEVTPADANEVEAAAGELIEGEIKKVEAVDITFRNAEGVEIQPLKPIQVVLLPKTIANAKDATVVHVDGDGKADVVEAEAEGAKVTFEAEKFSVYALVYTVDFSYEVDGKVYRFSMPGGGFVSLTDLVEVLGIIGDTNSDENAAESAEIAKENAVNEGAEESGVNSETNTALTLGDVEVSDDTRKFVADMESVEFSNPELVDISKVEAYTTVGQIKESRGLDVEYSAELTEEKIAEINGTVVESGDWALISVHPFDTEETLTVTMKDGEVFTIKVTDAQYINGATVHYGYMEGNTFHEFTSEQFTPPTSGFGTPAYLIYDVPGYQYAGTTYHDYETTNPYWPWESVKHHDEVPPIIEFQNATGDYYVCYEPRPTATQGGTSSIQEDYPQEPTVLKKSAENPNTGTNTISLEVSGPQKTAKAKADIIVIYDVSGSMRFPIGFNSLTDVQPGEDAGKYIVPDTDPSQRNYIVKRAIQKLASELMGEQTAADPAVRMGIVPFSTSAGTIVPFTGSADTFNRAVGSLALGGGTNWEDALQAANAMSVREDADTYVIFVTDGNPTFRISRQGATDSQITSVDNKSGVTRDYYDQLGIFGTGNADADKSSTDSLNRNYDAALAIAKAIVGSSKNLYGIGISEEAKKLENLINESGTGGNYYEVTTQGGIEPAIEDIKNQIKEKTFGYSDVQISDGITALTQTVQKTGMTNLPDSDDFEYFKGHAATQEDVDAGKAAKVGDTVWETWTAEQMAKEGAGRAAYNSDTGAVEWNLGETFMLEEGVSYKVDFTVWPSQEAYDLLADLNNGLKDYDTLDQSVRAQIKKNGTGENATYTLKTNRDDETGNPAGYTYKKATKEGEDGDVTPTGDPIPGTFDPVIPLKLRTDKIGVEKSFSNLLDSRDPTQIQLELWGNRLYKTFTLTKDGQWKSDDNYISCGLLTVDKETDKLYVYETGHDFTLKETGEDSIYWELTADTYHPMVINDVLHMLSKVDAPVGMSADTKYYCADDGKEYYRVEGNVYRDEGTDAVLKAVNDHRSFLDLSKEVIGDGDEPVASDDLFTFEAQFNESRTDDDIIFTVYDTVSKEYISDVSITTATLTPADDATNTRPYYVAKNNTKFTLKIKQGWNVRFLNLSNATTYTIKEVLEDTEYVFIKIEGDAKKTGTDHNSASVNTHMTITLGNTEMSGTIEEANVLYSVKYTNKAPKKKIQILKTDQSGSTPLKGAEFSLYGSDHYDEEGNVNPEAQALESNKATDQNGILDLGQYTWGTYYLVEEKAPEGYIKLDKPIKIVLSASPAYEQSESSLSTSGNGITPLQDEGQRVMGYQFKVTNDAGYELPSTGGSGTTLLYLFGGILILGAGVLLWRRRRLI